MTLGAKMPDTNPIFELPPAQFSVNGAPKIPHDRAAEEAVIGSVLLNPSAFHELLYLAPGDFFIRRNGTIWATVAHIMRAGDALDLLTLAHELDRRGELADIGGQAYLTALITAVPTSLHAARYGDLVRRHAQNRRLLAVSSRVIERVHEGADPDEIVSEAMPGMLADALPNGGAQHVDVGPLVDEFLERCQNPTEVWGLRTGFADIDRALGGLHPGEVFLLVGEPGAGKSMLAAQMGFQMAGLPFWPGHQVGCVPGAMYQLEMTTTATLRRAACALAQLDSHKVRSGQLAQEQQDAFYYATDRLHKSPVFISDNTHWTTTTMRSDLVRLMGDHGIRWVLIDYAGLLKDRAGSEYERDQIVSKALHDIAKMGLAVIAVETLNKDGLKGDSGLGAVRGTVQKAYDADVVAFLTEPDKDDPASRLLFFRKAREADKKLAIPLRMFGAQKRIVPATTRSIP